MFQPLLDLIQSFIDQVARIADALEVIAKAQYVLEDVDRRNRELKEEQERARMELRKKTLAELDRLKIPYSHEMPVEQLVEKLEDNKDRAEAKLNEATNAKKHEPKKPEPKQEEPKAKKPEPKKEEPKKPEPKQEEPKKITDEMMKEELVKISEVKGDAFVIDFFKNYPLNTPAVKFGGIALEERAAFLADLKAAASESEGDQFE